jgi:hypothetical protein
MCSGKLVFRQKAKAVFKIVENVGPEEWSVK